MTLKGGSEIGGQAQYRFGSILTAPICLDCGRLRNAAKARSDKPALEVPEAGFLMLRETGTAADLNDFVLGRKKSTRLTDCDALEAAH